MRYILGLLLVCVSGIGYCQDRELGDNHIYADLSHPNRTLNLKGQCVYNSITNASRQIGEDRLANLISDRRCQGGANPSDIARILPTFEGVKWEQEYRSRKKCYELIRKAMSLGLPCSISYGQAHMLNLIHFDEKSNLAIIVNNHNDRYQNKSMTIKQFDSKFKGWVVVIYPPEKAMQQHQEFLRNRLIDLSYYAPGNQFYYDPRYDTPGFRK